MKITLEGVTKIFPSRSRKKPEPVVAVNNFSFEFPDGTLVAILGPSGCGKSTTLHLISGLERPSEGRVLFGENDMTEVPAENRGVGLVFQSYALYPHLSVLRNITFPLENLRGKDKLTREERERRAYEAARLVQIDELMDRRPSELSGGQMQRVAIARALVKLPSVLLLDEPLSNLDARLRLKTREEIRRIQRATGITTLFVTHDQEEAMSISDLIVVMRDGVVMQTGKPQEVYDNPECLFVATFLGTPPINVFSASVSSGKLFIDGTEVLDVAGAPDGEVFCAIRPEGFVPDGDGALACSLDTVEVMGRDVSAVCAHPSLISGEMRAIVPSDASLEECGDTVKFRLKPSKVYLFDKQTEKRIYFEI